MIFLEPSFLHLEKNGSTLSSWMGSLEHERTPESGTWLMKEPACASWLQNAAEKSDNEGSRNAVYSRFVTFSAYSCLPFRLIVMILMSCFRQTWIG